jgi:hypothetical protein
MSFTAAQARAQAQRRSVPRNLNWPGLPQGQCRLGSGLPAAFPSHWQPEPQARAQRRSGPRNPAARALHHESVTILAAAAQK